MLGGVLTPVFAADGTLVLAAELEAAEARIAELEKPMTNKLDGTTHWETCATEGGRHHYDCAVARIRELESSLAAAEKQGDAAHEACLGYEAHVAELEAALREIADMHPDGNPVYAIEAAVAALLRKLQ